MKKFAKLIEFIKSTNIVELLDDDKLNKIGMKCKEAYLTDKASRADWESMAKDAMDLALQVKKDKSFPWPNAANVKYPIITTAAIQFSARAYPELVKGQKIVKPKVIGPDADGVKKEKADRIANHMSYQLLEEMDDWEEQLDKMLLQLGIIGCTFKKVYYSPVTGYNCSEFVSAMNLIYDHSVSWEKLKRKTQEFKLSGNEILERQRAGVFKEDLKLIKSISSSILDDDDGEYDFLEQHCWLDLDGDDYKEPYVVTILKESSEVARIVACYDEENRPGETR